MEYKGYQAAITYEEDTNSLHGRVLGIRDVIVFEGSSVEEMGKEFRFSVDDYLAMCAERGQEPAKPFSGRISLRLTPELHRKAVASARISGKSLNTWLAEMVTDAVSEPLPMASTIKDRLD